MRIQLDYIPSTTNEIHANEKIKKIKRYLIKKGLLLIGGIGFIIGTGLGAAAMTISIYGENTIGESLGIASILTSIPSMCVIFAGLGMSEDI